MILPINIYSDEVLKKKARPMKGVDSSTQELVAAMFESMRNAAGIGLAAPQVGHSVRLIVVDISCMKEYPDEKPMVVINPHLLSVKGTNIMEEGCLSIPGVQGDVLRPASITLKYRDEYFREQTGEFSGMLARVLQHEIDHLDGMLFVDRLGKRDRRKVQGMLNDLASGIVDAPYPHSREISSE
jgi:peptide deformylase